MSRINWTRTQYVVTVIESYELQTTTSRHLRRLILHFRQSFCLVKENVFVICTICIRHSRVVGIGVI